MTINYKCDKCDYEWYDKFTRSMFKWYLNFLCKCPKCKSRNITEQRHYRC